MQLALSCLSTTIPGGPLARRGAVPSAPSAQMGLYPSSAFCGVWPCRAARGHWVFRSWCAAACLVSLWIDGGCDLECVSCAHPARDPRRRHPRSALTRWGHGVQLFAKASMPYNLQFSTTEAAQHRLNVIKQVLNPEA